MESTPQQIIVSSLSQKERVSLGVCRPQTNRIPSLRPSISQPLWKDVTSNTGRAHQRSHQRLSAGVSIQPSLSRLTVLGQRVHSRSPLKLHRTTQTDIDRKELWMIDKQSIVFPDAEVSFCLSGSGSGECPRIFTLRENPSSTSFRCICEEKNIQMLEKNIQMPGITCESCDSVLVSKAVQTEVNDQIPSARIEAKPLTGQIIAENNQRNLEETTERDGDTYYLPSQNKDTEQEFDNNVNSTSEISECLKNNSSIVGLNSNESVPCLDEEPKPLHNEDERRSNATHSRLSRCTRFADPPEMDCIHEQCKECDAKDSTRSLLPRLIWGIMKLVLKLLIIAFWMGILTIVVSAVTSYSYCVATIHPVLLEDEDQEQRKAGTILQWFFSLFKGDRIVLRFGVNWENTWNGMKMCLNPTVINPWPMSDVFGSEKHGRHNFKLTEYPDGATIVLG